MTTITLAELIVDALELSGRAGTTADARVIRAVNKGIRWVWNALAAGYDGFATLETEILTGASGERVSIAAGQGGANRPDGTPTNPIVRGVHKVRGIYRSTSASSTDRYPACWTTREHYYDEYAPRLDDDNTGRPGWYWLDASDDGVIDDIVLRPKLDGAELIRLIYTPQAPVLADSADTLAMLDNAADAVIHMSGYYMLYAQDRQLAQKLKIDAGVIVQESVLAYKGVRASAGPRSIEDFKRRKYWRGWSR